MRWSIANLSASRGGASRGLAPLALGLLLASELALLVSGWRLASALVRPGLGWVKAHRRTGAVRSTASGGIDRALSNASGRSVSFVFVFYAMSCPAARVAGPPAASAGPSGLTPLAASAWPAEAILSLPLWPLYATTDQSAAVVVCTRNVILWIAPVKVAGAWYSSVTGLPNLPNVTPVTPEDRIGSVIG